MMAILSFVFLLAMGSSVMAATISPGSGIIGSDPYTYQSGDTEWWWGGVGQGNPSNKDLLDAVPSLINYSETLKQVYKSKDNPETAEGEFTVDGIYLTGSPVYLIVKDGNHSPAAYIFNLMALGWQTGESIQLTNFWKDPDQGSISHVEILGGPGVTVQGGGVPVPDGGLTAILLGLAIAGISTLRGFTKKL